MIVLPKSPPPSVQGEEPSGSPATTSVDQNEDTSDSAPTLVGVATADPSAAHSNPPFASASTIAEEISAELENDPEILRQRIRRVEKLLAHEKSVRQIYSRTLRQERMDRENAEGQAVDAAAILDAQLAESMNLYSQSESQLETLKSSYNSLRVTNQNLKSTLLQTQFDVQKAEQLATERLHTLNSEIDRRQLADRAFFAQQSQAQEFERQLKLLKEGKRTDESPSPSPPPERAPVPKANVDQQTLKDLSRYAHPNYVPHPESILSKSKFHRPFRRGDLEPARSSNPTLKLDGVMSTLVNAPGSPFYQALPSSKPVADTSTSTARWQAPSLPPGMSIASPAIFPPFAKFSQAPTDVRSAATKAKPSVNAETAVRVYPLKSPTTTASQSLLKMTGAQASTPLLSKSGSSSSSSPPIPVIDMTNELTTDEESPQAKKIPHTHHTLKRGQEAAQVSPTSIRRQRFRRGFEPSTSGAPSPGGRLTSPEVQSICETIKSAVKHPALTIATTPPAIATPSRLQPPRRSITLIASCPKIDVVDPIRILPTTPARKKEPQTPVSVTMGSTPSASNRASPVSSTKSIAGSFNEHLHMDPSIEALISSDDERDMVKALDSISPSRGGNKSRS